MQHARDITWDWLSRNDCFVLLLIFIKKHETLTNGVCELVFVHMIGDETVCGRHGFNYSPPTDLPQTGQPTRSGRAHE